jgi:hypothetical protein
MKIVLWVRFRVVSPLLMCVICLSRQKKKAKNLIMVNPISDFSHLLAPEPEPEPSHLDLILPYQHAHKLFIIDESVLPAANATTSRCYAWAVEKCPGLSKFKMYHDSSTFIEKQMRYATGEHLEAMIVWTVLVKEFWKRAVKVGTCPVYVSAYNVSLMNGLAAKLLERREVSKPYRRKSNGGIKRPRMPATNSLPADVFH